MIELQPITITDVTLHPVALPLLEPLKTSYGAEPFKSAVIVALHTAEGVVGWGESPTKMHPSYSYETMGTAWHVLKEFLVPAVVGQRISDPTTVPALLHHTRGHPMAKYGLESAVWDAVGKHNGLSLADLFARYLPEDHTPRESAHVGVSIGIQPTLEATLAVIQNRVDQGYDRVKLKIAPGWDVELARGVREMFPNILLMLDANSAYTLADAEHLKQLDGYNLLMLEQPLGHDDIYEHSKLQPQLQTPICLDESIHTPGDARLALALGAARIINLKPARVGGYTHSLEIYRICVAHEAPLWIGGMLETGIGRAANLAFASLPGVTLPCDISATDRYYVRDLTDPHFVLSENSRIHRPQGPGIGVTVLPEVLADAEARWRDNQPYAEASQL